ncbi:MAG: glycosyltransferase family 39 protein [Planctomycetota bacterium]
MDAPRKVAASLLWAALPAALFLAATVPSLVLGRFGPGWDFGVVYYGERYLDFYLSGFDAAYLDFDKPYPGRPDPTVDIDSLRTQGPELSWPVGPLAAAITRRLTLGLGLLGPVEGYHLAPLLFAALAVGALCRYAREALGRTAALAAAFFFATYPAFLGLSFHDPKDIPAVGLFTWAIVLGARAVEQRSSRLALLFGFALGMGLAAKTNTIVAPFILLLWLLACGIQRSLRAHPGKKVLACGLLATLLLAPLTFFVLWPWFWQDPLPRVLAHIERLWEDRYGAASLGQAFLEAALTSPPVVLLFFVLGIGFWKRAPAGPARRALLLALLWLCVPLIRASAPNVRYYDGVRRFIEFAAPLSLLAAWGVQATLQALGKWRLARAAIAGIVLLAALPALRSHPNEVAYYNFLVGGTRGAQARAYEGATDLWASSYRRAIEWLSAHAEQDAVIVVPVAPHVARMARDLHGRHDLRISSPPFLDPSQIPDSSFYVLYVTKPTYYDGIVRVCEEKLQPALEYALDGAPLLRLHHIAAGSEAHTLIHQVVARARANAEARLRDLQKQACGPAPSPRIVGAYVHTIVQLRGVDEGLLVLDHIIAGLNDATLAKELRFYRDQLEASRPFHDATRRVQ